ncbi:hypothetical protein EVAR_23681_1 [Eumeta japonica]|uniref:Uncharacterized protein n=1 Tax=Eumeta variegata TaxID=151549 RepID=A0A4C1VL58_EUMVA|nr:hypothetical protein EVAR_23681_1 [Eumeta japonica]
MRNSRRLNPGLHSNKSGLAVPTPIVRVISRDCDNDNAKYLSRRARSNCSRLQRSRRRRRELHISPVAARNLRKCESRTESGKRWARTPGLVELSYKLPKTSSRWWGWVRGRGPGQGDDQGRNVRRRNAGVQGAGCVCKTITYSGEWLGPHSAKLIKRKEGARARPPNNSLYLRY